MRGNSDGMAAFQHQRCRPQPALQRPRRAPGACTRGAKGEFLARGLKCGASERGIRIHLPVLVAAIGKVKEDRGWHDREPEMAIIKNLNAGFYRLPLKEVLVDAMHGEHHHFEIITVEISDEDGATGTGYTFTGGHNGGAIFDIASREFPPHVIGEDADRIEKLWNKLWWVSHYGGRGGPTVLALSALDIALWDLKAKKAGIPLWKLLGGRNGSIDT